MHMARNSGVIIASPRYCSSSTEVIHLIVTLRNEASCSETFKENVLWYIHEPVLTWSSALSYSSFDQATFLSTGRGIGCSRGLDSSSWPLVRQDTESELHSKSTRLPPRTLEEIRVSSFPKLCSEESYETK